MANNVIIEVRINEYTLATLPDSSLPEDCEEVRLLCGLATLTKEHAMDLYRRATKQP